MPKTIHFDGDCPFLTCLISSPHDHPICPKCGAVRYGNLFCSECQKQRQEIVIELAGKTPDEINIAMNKSKSERIAELMDEVTQYKAEELGWHNTAIKWEKIATDRGVLIDALQENNRLLSIENVRLMNSKQTNIFNLRQYPA